MPRAHLLAAIPALLVGLMILGGAAQAQPACTPTQAGARICMVGQACTCTYDRGGQLTAQPPGWRWTCSLLETCEPPPPATLPSDSSTPPMMMLAPTVEWGGPPSR